MIKINIQTRIKLKNLKSKLSKAWYWSMKPLAKLLTYLDGQKYERFENRAINMDINEVVKRATKVIIGDLIRYSKYDEYLDIIVANYGNWDGYETETIIEHMQRQRKDKKLQTFAYHIRHNKVDFNRTLTEALAEELKKNGCKVEFITDKETYGYYKSNGYEKTMIVRL